MTTSTRWGDRCGASRSVYRVEPLSRRLPTGLLALESCSSYSLAIAYDAFITGVIKSARTGGDGVCAPAHTATTETDRTSRDCNKAAWYLNTQMPQLPTTGAVGLDAAAMGIRLGRGEKMYLVQFPASTAPDGSNMFIPSNGIGLELERVPVTDASAECIFRVLKNAEDHLPKHVLDGLTFFGLDGSRGYERKVLKGDRLLAVNSRIVCNTTRLYHDGVFCSESFPRTYLMVRDVKIQRVRAVTQISGGVRKTTRADESKKMVIRCDETKRRRRTSSKKADVLEEGGRGSQVDCQDQEARAW